MNHRKVYELRGRVIANREVARDTFYMWLEAAEIARTARPGQFVNFVIPGNEVFFPRPFSVADVNEDRLAILYQVVGKGTRIMSHWTEGEPVSLLGPLGQGFPVQENNHQVSILVAGGVGAAPLIFLNNWLVEKEREVIFYIGARSANYHFDFLNKGPEPILATDDGSLGRPGNVVEVLERDLPLIKKTGVIYSCGPEKMIRALKGLSNRLGIVHYTALERVMACGLGICQGCAIPDSTHKNYFLICKHGPVFDVNLVSI